MSSHIKENINFQKTQFSNKKNIDVSVAIPLYNSSKTIEILINRSVTILRKLKLKYEFVLVDDASKDDTWEIVTRFLKKNINFTIARHNKNLGYNKTIFTALGYCRGKFIITLDDDLQHSPEEIPNLLIKQKEGGYDVVFANFKNRRHSFITNLGSAFYLYLLKIGNSNFSGNFEITSFRLISDHVVKSLLEFNLNEPQLGFMILKITNNIGYIQVSHLDRLHGKSGITFKKRIKNTIDMIFSVTTIPLKVVFFLGSVVLFFSVLLIIYYLINYFISETIVDGFTTIVVLTLLLNGLSIFTIGILGIYLSKVIDNLQFNNKNPLKDVFTNDK